MKNIAVYLFVIIAVLVCYGCKSYDLQFDNNDFFVVDSDYVATKHLRDSLSGIFQNKFTWTRNSYRFRSETGGISYVVIIYDSSKKESDIRFTSTHFDEIDECIRQNVRKLKIRPKSAYHLSRSKYVIPITINWDNISKYPPDE